MLCYQAAESADVGAISERLITHIMLKVPCLVRLVRVLHERHQTVLAPSQFAPLMTWHPC
jgi:hypothetical protein